MFYIIFYFICTESVENKKSVRYVDTLIRLIRKRMNKFTSFNLFYEKKLFTSFFRRNRHNFGSVATIDEVPFDKSC